MRWIRLLLGFGVCILLTAASCTPRSPAPTKPIASAIFQSPPTCGGGPGTQRGTMNDQAALLARYINSYRSNILQNELTPDPVLNGVAQWHAEDMAKHGYVGLVDGILKKMIAELGGAVRVVATGGLAPLIAKGSGFIQEVDETLTLEGLRLVYERQK